MTTPKKTNHKGRTPGAKNREHKEPMKNINFRIPAAERAEFYAKCEARKTVASQVLRELMKKY